MTTQDAAVRLDDVIIVLCIGTGAVVGFSLTGGAAIGTGLGALVGLAIVHLRPHGRKERR